MTTFPDQVHVERIAEALWRKSPLGTAALMIGAGLSRNARNVAAPGRAMPTWEDLGNRLCDSLYPPGDKSCAKQREHAKKKAAATSGALRLAQEYEASFGRTELNRLLKTYVPDEEFVPSSLHVDFLKLPWADVFTTNWDTLLERATDIVVDRRYDVVRTRDDIPASQQPRIVKLHGSFPSNYPFIFSEEDYRKYPTDFPCFVNMVQQSMMENLFCLIGFSGDDPNFLHWAGWVRDNLGEAAPKIYLVGWLDLAPVQRRVLEDRNVIPVDLSRLPQGTSWPEECRYRYALEWFQWMLKLKQPLHGNAIAVFQREHRLTSPEHLKIDQKDIDSDKPERLSHSKISGPGKEAERLEEIRSQRVLWEEDRKKYEGWVVAPQRVRNQFWAYTEQWVCDVARIIPHMEPWERLFTLREIVWRIDVCLAPIDKVLVEPLVQTLDEVDSAERKCTKDGSPTAWPDPDWAEARRVWSELAAVLLRHYRFEGSSSDFRLLAQRLEQFSDCNGVMDNLAYQRVMLAIQEMDYVVAKSLLASWRLDGSDHIWAIRKAGVLFELGEFDDAHELLIAVLPVIRHSTRRDLDDYAALSREGCAMQLREIAELEVSFRGNASSRPATASSMVRNDINSFSSKTPFVKAPSSNASGGDKNSQATNRDETKNPDWQARWKTLLAKDCDVRDEWQTIVARLGAAPPDPRVNREIRKRSFDLGQATISRHYGSGGQFLPAYRVLAFAEAAGMPPVISTGFSGVIVSAKGLQRAAIWLKTITISPELAVSILLRTCSSGSDDTLKEVATRETIALLDYEFVEKFVTILLRGINDIAASLSSDKKQLEKLRVAMELLSRVSQRITAPEKKRQIFDHTISIVHNGAVSGHLWLAGELFNLLRRDIDCFETSTQHNLILPLLGLPTSGLDERTFVGEPWWDDFSEIREEQLRSLRDCQLNDWNEVISRLLADAEKQKSRKRAVWRLTFLHGRKLLSELEQRAFAKVLWAVNFSGVDGLPGHADLYPWVFLDLPELETGTAERLIREKYLTRENASKESVGSYLENVGRIMNAVRERRWSFNLSAEDASIISSKIAEWTRQEIRPSQHPFAHMSSQKDISILIGVARLLPFSSIAKEHIPNVLARISEVEAGHISCYSLYPPIMIQHPELTVDFIGRLKTGMANDDPDLASNAVHALGYWLSLAETGHADLPPDHLLEEVGLAVYLRREPVLAAALLFCVHLFEKQPEAAIRTISERVKLGLDFLFESCQYQEAIISGLSERIDIPLVRYYCVKLTIAMSKAGCADQAITQWLDAAPDDPLAEVRNLIAEYRGQEPAPTEDH